MARHSRVNPSTTVRARNTRLRAVVSRAGAVLQRTFGPLGTGRGTRIVDDEPLARRGIVQLLAAHPDVAVAGECGDGPAAVAAIRADPPDLVFLDVQMPELDGFGVVRAVGAARMPATVFLTAYAEFAVDAFGVDAVDYLVKPVTADRLAAALARARRRIGGAAGPAPTATSAPPPAPPPSPPNCLLVPTARGELVLPVDEVDWVGADDYYVAVHARGRRHLVRESLAAMEARLDGRRFARAHRGALVNLGRVREVRAAAAGRLTAVLRDGTALPVSRRRAAAFARALRAWADPARRDASR
jgi:two-component system LytT family response regulator